MSKLDYDYEPSVHTSASGLTAAAKIWPIEFQNQQAVLIRSLAFWPVDGRPYPVSGSMCQTSKVIKITFWRLPLTCIKLCCVSPNRFWVFVANKRTTTTFHEVAPLYRNSRKFSLVMWIIGTQYWCRIFFRCYIISKMRHIKKVLPKIYK